MNTNVEMKKAIVNSPFESITLKRQTLIDLLDASSLDADQLRDLHAECVNAVEKRETEFYDVDSAQFEIDGDNCVKLSSVDINFDYFVETILDIVLSK